MRKIILIIALFLFLCPCISVYGEETDEDGKSRIEYWVPIL